MAMPSSGPISMSQINTELGRSSNAQISLDSAENGGYATINQCSVSKPVLTNPAKLSEWYSYNHSASCSGLPVIYIDTYSYGSTTIQFGAYDACNGSLLSGGNILGKITINFNFIRQTGINLGSTESASLEIFANSNVSDILTLTSGTFFSYEITSIFIEGAGAQLNACAA